MAPRLSLFVALLAASLACGAQKLPSFPAKNVQDTYHGTVVDDPYRALENVKDPQVGAWMKAHADAARSSLEGLKGYGELKARVVELFDAVEARVGEVRKLAGGELFFTRRGVKDNTYKLYVRTADGKVTLLVDPDDWQKSTGKPHAINYFAPSWDGKLVAFGISASGSEAASIHVLDVATRKTIGKPVDRAQYAGISWRTDNRSFFFLREQELKPGMSPLEKYQNGRNWLYTVGSDIESATVVLGPGVSPRVEVPRTDFPYVIVTPGSKYAIAAVYAGVQRELSLWSAPLETVGKPDTPWVKICDKADKVTDYAVHGDDIFLMTYRENPRFAIVRTSLAKPEIAKAETIVPVSEQVLTAVAAARDALYMTARDGAVLRLKRLAWKGREAATVKLPLEGAVGIMSATTDADGAIVSLAAWTRAREIYAVDPSGKVTNTGLQPLGKFDAPTDLVATEVKVKSHDGAMVPLSIIHKKGIKLDGNNPTLLYGYGSYGITEEPNFGPTRLAWLERGGVYAVANPRGTSVNGYDWYQAGYKATKPNTWKDFIACAEYLIQQKYTSPSKLGILGGSAGGILVGRAMTERPDLFGAVIDAVGANDMVRMETTANGIPNIPEFGTVKTPEGFKALLEMSPYHHVKDGTKYPAVMLTHGVNDPRVDVWQSSKFGARLMAASASGKPILLNLDYESGHGIGDTKAQQQRQVTDFYAFLLWQAGHPNFQPSR